MSYLQLLQFAGPEAIVVATALILLTIGLTSNRSACFLRSVGCFGLASAISIVWLLPAKADLFHGMLVLSPLNALFKTVCLLLAFCTLLLARPENFTPHRAEFFALLLLATVGLLLLIGSEELLMIFIGLELTGLTLYVLTAFDKSSQRSAEAGLKYFLFGSMASAFTLYGLSLIYGATDSTRLVVIADKLAALPMTPLLAAGMIMALVGFAFKIAAAPFHLWAPDTYQAAPVPAAAFIASGSKVASFVVLGKILLLGFSAKSGNGGWHSFAAGWSPIIATLAALSILIGNLVALAQKNVRRLLAYSAIAHGGYTLLGLLAGGRDGFGATLFYTTTYAFTLVGTFGVVEFVRQETGGDDLKNFAGLRARSPLLAGCIAIFLLSLAGLPPLAGFFGKFFLFSVAVKAGSDHRLLWLVIIALMASLISLYYYLVILRAVFAETPALEKAGSSMAFSQRATIAALALLVLLLGLLPQSLLARILSSL